MIEDEMPTFKKMKSACSYLYWAIINKLDLRFTPTEDDFKMCDALGNSKIYHDVLSHSDLTGLGSYEFLVLLLEFVRVVKDNEKFHLEPVFSKYHKHHFKNNLDKTEKPVFPKFIHYSAHAETLEYIF
jgi:hypothetical protein